MKNELPPKLAYLQEFLDYLNEIPAEELNEDLDSSLLEKALRKRIGAVNLKKAKKFLEADKKQLEKWLEGTGDSTHPAYWILGFFSLPGLSKKILEVASSEDDPTITFESPKGWDFTEAPLQLNCQKGKLVASITIIDGLGFRLNQSQWESACRKVTVIDDGKTKGKKYCFIQKTPFYMKRIDYFLEISGGYCTITLQSMYDEFDESDFEKQLHTLKIILS